MFSIFYLCYVTCHTQWAWVTYAGTPVTFSQNRIQPETGLKWEKDPTKIITKHPAQTSESKSRHISGVLNMLTFQWKFKMLKQIEGSWNAWDIFAELEPRLLHVPKMASALKKPLLSRFFKRTTWTYMLMYFFALAFEDLSFHSILRWSRFWGKERL